jgi:hypothetical protein
MTGETPKLNVLHGGRNPYQRPKNSIHNYKLLAIAVIQEIMSGSGRNLPTAEI